MEYVQRHPDGPLGDVHDVLRGHRDVIRRRAGL